MLSSQAKSDPTLVADALNTDTLILDRVFTKDYAESFQTEHLQKINPALSTYLSQVQAFRKNVLLNLNMLFTQVDRGQLSLAETNIFRDFYDKKFLHQSNAFESWYAQLPKVNAMQALSLTEQDT